MQDSGEPDGNNMGNGTATGGFIVAIQGVKELS